MNISFLLLGILPLLAFVIIDSFAGVKAGVVAAIVFALLEIIYSFVAYGFIDEITLASGALVVIFGLLSYASKKEIYMKLQPVVVGVSFAGILLVMQALGRPLLVILLGKYKFMLPPEARELALNPASILLIGQLSGLLGWGFLVHAALVAFCAFRMNTWWWLLARSLGLYAMMFACVLTLRMTQV